MWFAPYIKKIISKLAQNICCYLFLCVMCVKLLTGCTDNLLVFKNIKGKFLFKFYNNTILVLFIILYDISEYVQLHRCSFSVVGVLRLYNSMSMCRLVIELNFCRISLRACKPRSEFLAASSFISTGDIAFSFAHVTRCLLAMAFHSFTPSLARLCVCACLGVCVRAGADGGPNMEASI